MKRLLSIFACAAVSAALPPALAAQTLHEQCPQSPPDARTFCENVADAVMLLQPRIGVGLTGGNPVPGSASTLGLRLGKLPRVSLGVRVTAAAVELPPIERMGRDQELRFPVGSVAADASVGVFPGLSLLPTVGGFGSIDVLGSVGAIPLPRGEGFGDSWPITWALGARLGLLRESFTAPGISISAMYRSLNDVAYGDEQFTERDAFFRVSDYDVMSLRGAIGKRLLGFGLTAGAGWDRYTADILARVRVTDPFFGTQTFTLEQDDLTSTRASVFANASFTLLILNFAAELGWQQGGDAIQTARESIDEGGLFGGLAIRVAI